MGNKKKNQEQEDLPIYVWRITPKGCAWSALYDSDIHVGEEQFNEFWHRFEQNMRMCGYIDESNTDSK